MSTPHLNETHDPAARSWVQSANQPDCDFPLQNLPLAVFRAGSAQPFRAGVAIGDQILDLGALHEAGLLTGSVRDVLQTCASPTLNAFMALGNEAWSALRRAAWELLREEGGQAGQQTDRLQGLLVPQKQAQFTVPAHIGDYTDFYASIHHATAVGKLLRPDNPLLPNYRWVPIAYHGRASSIGVSGQCVPRPRGQVLPAGAAAPEFRPTARLDYELEVGIFIGQGNRRGEPIPISEAEQHIFGLCLLNDWSARDVQAWEYQPLGPFLAKNFATTLSPWIVTLEALAPYRVPWTRPASDPQPLPYLDCAQVRASGGIDMQLTVSLQTERMRSAGREPQRLSQSNLRDCYWSAAQLLAHHTSNGCNLQPGDLLGTGTQSGPEPLQAGSLLELTSGGKRPLLLGSGETRTFLEDGDRVILRGRCCRSGHATLGFGEASGTVLPAAQNAK